MFTINSLYLWVYVLEKCVLTKTIKLGHCCQHTETSRRDTLSYSCPSAVLTEAERSDTILTWFSGLHYRKNVHVIDDAEQSCCPQHDRVKLCHVCFTNMCVRATQLRRLLSRVPRHPANVPYVIYISIQNATPMYISHMLCIVLCVFVREFVRRCVRGSGLKYAVDMPRRRA